MAHKVKDLLKSFIQQEASWKHLIIKNWHEIMGNLSDKVQLIRATKDTLVLGVHDSSWLQELYLLSPILIKQINQKLDQPYVKELRFKRLARPKKMSIQRTRAKKRNYAQSVKLNSKEEKILSAVQDQELKKVLRTFLVRCYQEKKNEEVDNTLTRFKPD